MSGRFVFLPEVLLLVAGAASSPAMGQASSPEVSRSPSVKTPVQLFELDEHGVLSRTLFHSADAGSISVTIREIVVGPRRTQQMSALSGPALLELFEGHGTIAIDSSREQAIENEFQTVPADLPFVISNPSNRPVGIRLYVFAER